MKGKIIKKEIVHNLELTEEELKRLAYICKHFMDTRNVVTEEYISTCKDILNYASYKEVEILEEPIQNLDDDLLNNDSICIKNNILIDDFDDDFDVVAHIGKNGQLSLRVDDMDEPVFFNRECTILIRDFIDRLGEGSFRGVGSFNSNKYFELDLYLDNKGNRLNHISTNKKMILRYYYSIKGTPFGILKDNNNEIRLKHSEAQLLSKFISRHF